MKRPWIDALVAVSAMSLLAATVVGCAKGGGTGPFPPDGGVVLMDSGPGVDGRVGFDAGPPVGFDAGPPGFDAGGPTCSETPCQLVSPQCGCATGQGCYLSGANRVCGTPGPEATGQACSGATACQAGNLCLGSAGAGFCARFCNTDAECSGAGSLCLLQVDDGTGTAVPGVTLCTGSCSPASGIGCPSTMGCAIFEESMGAMRTFTGCRAAGTTREGSACTQSEDCVPGTFCGGATGSQQCYRWCTLPRGSECTGIASCNSFTTPALVGGVEYGFCL